MTLKNIQIIIHQKWKKNESTLKNIIEEISQNPHLVEAPRDPKNNLKKLPLIEHLIFSKIKKQSKWIEILKHIRGIDTSVGSIDTSFQCVYQSLNKHWKKNNI